jgi:hypothetical protein
VKDFVHNSGEFSDAGRTFDVYVAYGPDASPKTFSELWTILNGTTFHGLFRLKVRPEPSYRALK